MDDTRELEDRETEEAAPRRPMTALRVVRGIVTGFLLPLLVIGGGAAVAYHFWKTKPKAERKIPPHQAKIVDVEEVLFAPHRIVVEAMGTVRPARSVDLRPRVSGEVVAMSDEFFPGGRFREGDALLRIDPSDYELAVAQRENDVARAEANITIEEGRQAIAKREFELLGEGVSERDRDLVLRKPQLRTVEAALGTARAALARAKLDLERTRIAVPFNCLVRTRDVNLGAQVSVTGRLATLVGTDDWWIETTVPVDRLRWIRIPKTLDEPGAAVTIEHESAWGAGVTRAGAVLRLAGDIEERGRMAKLLISVRDPLALGAESEGLPSFLIGEYVEVRIEGTVIENAAVVNRERVRDGDRVWVMNAEDRLEIRRIGIVWAGREIVLVREGLAPGDRIVVTDLAAPVEGMPLRVAGAEPGRATGPGAEGDGSR